MQHPAAWIHPQHPHREVFIRCHELASRFDWADVDDENKGRLVTDGARATAWVDAQDTVQDPPHPPR